MKWRSFFGKDDPRVTAPIVSWKIILVIIGTVFLFVAWQTAVISRSLDNVAAMVSVLTSYLTFVCMVFALGTWVYWRQTTGKPLRRIARAARRVASGDFGVQLPSGRKNGKMNEIDVLAADFNTMVRELAGNEMLKSDFIANVSHEIKTPLAVIQNYATALQGQLSDEVRTEYIKTLITAAKRLTNLVTNVLKLNKLENQEIVPAYNSVNAGELLRERLSETEEIIERKGLDFACDIDDVEICTDESFLEIVWNNLLSNAIKFTPAGGSIYVSLKEDESSLILTVRDTGCGMDAETGARIFDKFYQGDTSHSGEGNGLGLALVKKVVDILGGEISVQSEAGVGSEFTVKLRKQESESRKQKVESKK